MPQCLGRRVGQHRHGDHLAAELPRDGESLLDGVLVGRVDVARPGPVEAARCVVQPQLDLGARHHLEADADARSHHRAIPTCWPSSRTDCSKRGERSVADTHEDDAGVLGEAVEELEVEVIARRPGIDRHDQVERSSIRRSGAGQRHHSTVHTGRIDRWHAPASSGDIRMPLSPRALVEHHLVRGLQAEADLGT